MTNYTKKSFIQERLTLVLEHEKIKNKESKHFKKIKDLEEYFGHQGKVIREWYLKFVQSGRNPKVFFPPKKSTKKSLWKTS